VLRIIAALLALVAAVRAPHHDDTLHLITRVGAWDVVRGFDHLDEGVVTFVGEPCDHLHLAGHRTSHGAPFARLPELHAGDVLTVWSASVECTYRVDAVEVVTSNVQPPFGDLLAQCSWPDGFFLVFGTRV
jgi:sortase (surface protein transpeptidase)